MSRIDVPTMQCDRCKVITDDRNVMCKYYVLRSDNVHGGTQRDLCEDCASDFYNFMGEEK